MKDDIDMDWIHVVKHIVIFVFFLVLGFFMYATVTTLRLVWDGVQAINITLVQAKKNGEKNEKVMLDVIRELEQALQENTIAMTAHVDTMYRSYDGGSREESDIGSREF